MVGIIVAICLVVYLMVGLLCFCGAIIFADGPIDRWQSLFWSSIFLWLPDYSIEVLHAARQRRRFEEELRKRGIA